MNTQRLTKLQALLERVQSRSTRSPGARGTDGVAGPAVAAPRMVVQPVATPAITVQAAAAAVPPAVAVAAVAVQESSSYIDDSVDLPTWPPPPVPSNPPVVTGVPSAASVSSEPEISIDVDISVSEPPPPLDAEVATGEAAGEDGVGVSLDEQGSMGSESVERLVAAHPVPLEPAIEVVAASSGSAVQVAFDVEPPLEAPAPPSPDAPAEALAPEAEDAASALEPEMDAVAESDAVEAEIPRAPASSRRPVAPEGDEALADMAFGAEEARPPRHTPPPESGRLPAPPTDEFDADVTGVRAAPVQVQGTDGVDALMAASEPVGAEAPARALAPVHTRAELASADGVADIVGAAPAFAPQTFGEWLDAALAL